jgi:hypothetical protein
MQLARSLGRNESIEFFSLSMSGTYHGPGRGQLGRHIDSTTADKILLPLFRALKVNSSLTSFVYQGALDSTQRSIRVEDLAEAFQHNKTLTYFSFYPFDVEEQGISQLAEALKDNITLNSLILTGNKISRQGASALSDALKGSTSLTELNLSGSQMGDAGVLAFSHLVKNSTSLVSLGLFQDTNEEDPLTSKTIDILCEAVKLRIAPMVHCIINYNAPTGASILYNVSKIQTVFKTLNEAALNDETEVKNFVSDLKFFQRINKNPNALGILPIPEGDTRADYIKNIELKGNKYITEHYFQLIGVCKKKIFPSAVHFSLLIKK